MAKNIKRSTPISARTVPGAGTVTVVTVGEIGGDSPILFDELWAYLQITTAIAGTVPTLDVFLQRALVPNPNPATNNHWQDLFHFPQVAATGEHVAVLPVKQEAGSSVAADGSRSRLNEGEAADANTLGHWGDQIRIREVVTGTITAGVYSLHLTGISNK
jgi:hypothetical protein